MSACGQLTDRSGVRPAAGHVLLIVLSHREGYQCHGVKSWLQFGSDVSSFSLRFYLCVFVCSYSILLCSLMFLHVVVLPDSWFWITLCQTWTGVGQFDKVCCVFRSSGFKPNSGQYSDVIN